MKASKFFECAEGIHSEAGANGIPIAEIHRLVDITQAIYVNWKKKYVGLLPTKMKRLKHLEDENNKLRKLVVDLSPTGKCSMTLSAETVRPAPLARVCDQGRPSALAHRGPRGRDCTNGKGCRDVPEHSTGFDGDDPASLNRPMGTRRPWRCAVQRFPRKPES